MIHIPDPRIRLKRESLPQEAAEFMKAEGEKAREEKFVAEIKIKKIEQQEAGAEREARLKEFRGQQSRAEERIASTRILGADDSGGVVASDLCDEIKFRSADGRRLIGRCSELEFKRAIELVLGRPVLRVSENSERSVFVKLQVTGLTSIHQRNEFVSVLILFLLSRYPFPSGAE